MEKIVYAFPVAQWGSKEDKICQAPLTLNILVIKIHPWKRICIKNASHNIMICNNLLEMKSFSSYSGNMQVNLIKRNSENEYVVTTPKNIESVWQSLVSRYHEINTNALISLGRYWWTDGKCYWLVETDRLLSFLHIKIIHLELMCKFKCLS